MFRFHSRFIIFLSLVLFFSVSAIKVQALSLATSPKREALKQEIRTSLQNQVSTPPAVLTAKAAVCQRIEDRVNNRLQQYDANQNKWTTRHQGVIKRLQSLVTKLEAKNCDSAAIKSDIATYQELVNAFAASFADFHNTLAGTQAYVCGQSQGQFLNQLKSAQAKLSLVRQNAQKLQSFFETNLRPHLSQAAKACQEAK